MRYKKIESAIIKISIVIACLIIGAGTAQRVLGTKAEPVAPKVAATQNPAPAQPAQPSQENTGTGNAPAPQAIPDGKIVVIGDSYTSGGSYAMDKSWVNTVAKDLNREMTNKGKQGQASADVLSRFQNDVINASPKAVIIQVGTRDAFTKVSLEDYQKNIQQMVSTAKGKQIVPILCLPLPYPSKSTNDLITVYRGWLNSFAEKEGILTIDFNQDLVDTSTGVLRKNFVSSDGVMPNIDGYVAMAKTVEKVLGK